MSRGYTRVKSLVPGIKAMIKSGKTQREIAESLGKKDKSVIVVYCCKIRVFGGFSVLNFK